MQLVELLEKNLEEYGYSKRIDGPISNVPFIAVMATSRLRGLGAKYLNAIVDVPDDITTVTETKQFFSMIRKALVIKYWMLLGTYLVLLCKPNLYEKLRGLEKEFKDLSGAHLNVMLGTVLINKETFENSCDKTWGLFYSGIHFERIRTTVVEWCEIQKK